MSKTLNKALLSFCFITLLLPSLEAQIGSLDMRMGTGGRYTIRGRDVGQSIMIPYEPYLFPKERSTRIELIDGKEITGLFKYNVETETLEHASSDKIYELSQVVKFWFEATSDKPEQYFINLKLVWPDSEIAGFFESIPTSNLVWTKHFLEFKPADYNMTMDVGNPYDRVELEKDFFFKLNGAWTVLSKTRLDLYKMMEPYVDLKALKKFLRKEKVKLDSPEDVGSLMNWIAKNQN